MTRQVKTYNPNHIFVDTNVLIGAYSGDARFQTDSDCLHYLYSIVGKKLYASTLSVAQLISVYQKKKTNDEIRSIVRELQHRFTIVSFTVKDIDEALTVTVDGDYNCGLYGYNNYNSDTNYNSTTTELDVTSQLAETGFTVTRSARSESGGKYTWTYTVAPK